MLKKPLWLLVLLFSLTYADSSAEIKHLLHYVNTTACNYIRNGSVHNGKEAEKHIKAKYDHYKDEIKTTEDFIRLSATKSMLSGNTYYIQCPNSPKIESRKWLLAELKKYRNK